MNHEMNDECWYLLQVMPVEKLLQVPPFFLQGQINLFLFRLIQTELVGKWCTGFQNFLLLLAKDVNRETNNYFWEKL
jgi:hypothetical protein